VIVLVVQSQLFRPAQMTASSIGLLGFDEEPG